MKSGDLNRQRREERERRRRRRRRSERGQDLAAAPKHPNYGLLKGIRALSLS